METITHVLNGEATSLADGIVKALLVHEQVKGLEFSLHIDSPLLEDSEAVVYDIRSRLSDFYDENEEEAEQCLKVLVASFATQINLFIQAMGIEEELSVIANDEESSITEVASQGILGEFLAVKLQQLMGVEESEIIYDVNARYANAEEEKLNEVRSNVEELLFTLVQFFQDKAELIEELVPGKKDFLLNLVSEATELREKGEDTSKHDEILLGGAKVVFELEEVEDKILSVLEQMGVPHIILYLQNEELVKSLIASLVRVASYVYEENEREGVSVESEDQIQDAVIKFLKNL